MPRRLRSLALLALCVAGVAAAPARATRAQDTKPSTYHVARRIAVGGDGGWDYLTVDPDAHRLYLSRGTHVMVVDLDADRVVGDIPDTPGVHGVAIVRDLGKGYTSNGRDSSVTVFDLKTLGVRGRIRGTGANPDAIHYDEPSRRIFTFNGRSGDATAIDPRTDSVVGTVRLGGKPEAAVSDGRGRVFVNIEDRNEIVAFDARTLAVAARWPLTGCEEPSGLAIDRTHARLFAVCGNRVMAIVDDRSGKVLATVPIGEGSDGAAFDPGSGLAFSTNGDGTLTVVREDAPGHFAAASVPTERRARTIALDPRSHRVYTVTADFGEAPAPTAEQPRPRPPMVPGTFRVLVLEP